MHRCCWPQRKTCAAQHPPSLFHACFAPLDHVQVGPQPVTFGGQRRLAAHRDEPLLLEVLLSRVRPVAQGDELLQGDKVRLRAPFKFPAPPSPFGLPSAASS